MAIFPMLKTEAKVQVGDLIRLSAAGSIVSGGGISISKVEIKPHSGADFVNVTGDGTDNREWFLDWVYDAEGDKTVTVKVTDSDENEATKDVNVSVVTAAEDYLFSTDDDLKVLEPDILDWIPAGYSSWNHVHRAAQESILDWLDEIRIRADDGSRFAAADILDKTQVRRLSKLTALRMIFFFLSHQDSDIFKAKFEEYKKQEGNARQRNYIEVDFSRGDSSGISGPNVRQTSKDLRTFSMVRR